MHSIHVCACMHACTLHTQNSARELKEAQNTRITLKTIESLTYECSDGDVLKELNTKLEHVIEEFRGKLPLAGGLVIRFFNQRTNETN